MTSIRPLYLLFRDTLLGDPVSTQYEREQREQRTRAREEAEAEYHRIMANFYTDRVLAIDPNADWWGFAEAKQKQYDHQTECLRYERRAGGNPDFTDIPTLARAVRQPN